VLRFRGVSASMSGRGEDRRRTLSLDGTGPGKNMDNKAGGSVTKFRNSREKGSGT